MTDDIMTCEEFQTLLPGYLDGDAAHRDRADAHLIDCTDCAALVADLRSIVTEAADLPALAPSRDLWQDIEARIATAVVPLSTSGAHAIHGAGVVAPRRASRAFTTRRLALAASLLVMATAGITWTVASRRPVLVIPATTIGTPVAAAANKPSLDETYDREIGALRKLVDERRAELDSGTVGILEKNLLVIEKAIRESRDALARDPASAFLNGQLSRAYGTKLQLLRGVATLPARS